MNLAFFIVGGLIFAIYIYFTIWNIFYGARKQREENYPGYYERHGLTGGGRHDNMDYDGMGNFSRSSSTELNPKKRPKKNKTK